MRKIITQKQARLYFDSDGKLKIIKQWNFKGRLYSARRDTDGDIGIVDDEYYYSVGLGKYCYQENDIDALAKELGVM